MHEASQADHIFHKQQGRIHPVPDITHTTAYLKQKKLSFYTSSAEILVKNQQLKKEITKFRQNSSPHLSIKIMLMYTGMFTGLQSYSSVFH